MYISTSGFDSIVLVYCSHLAGTAVGGRDGGLRDGVLRVPVHLPGARDAASDRRAHASRPDALAAEAPARHKEAPEAPLLDGALSGHVRIPYPTVVFFLNIIKISICC